MVLVYLACFYLTICYLFGAYLLVRLITSRHIRLMFRHRCTNVLPSG